MLTFTPITRADLYRNDAPDTFNRFSALSSIEGKGLIGPTKRDVQRQVDYWLAHPEAFAC